MYRLKFKQYIKSFFFFFKLLKHLFILLELKFKLSTTKLFNKRHLFHKKIIDVNLFESFRLEPLKITQVFLKVIVINYL